MRAHPPKASLTRRTFALACSLAVSETRATTTQDFEVSDEQMIDAMKRQLSEAGTLLSALAGQDFSDSATQIISTGW